MMWAIRPGPEHNYIDGRTHVHHVHLFNQVTGGEHNVLLNLGCPKCPVCSRPFTQNNLSELDPAAEINAALATLSQNHNAIMAYAAKNGVPVRLGPLASLTPAGHKTEIRGSQKMLHVPRVK